MTIEQKLAEEFHLNPDGVANIIRLIDGGNTIPFIARYRKECTNGMDDQLLRELNERLSYLRALEARRQEVLSALTNAQALTPQLSQALERAETLNEVEDIYRPLRPKRRTRASIAKEQGLQPLADQLLAQKLGSPLLLAQSYVQDGLDAEAALLGARDIVAEIISDDAAVRKTLRDTLQRSALLVCASAKPGEDSVYAHYYQFQEPVSRLAPHRVLAINRGEKEGYLKVSLKADKDALTRLICNRYVKAANACAQQVRLAAGDALDRLIFPSLEREIRAQLTENAQAHAVKVFAMNLKNLLMQPPVRGHVILGLDPAYRTGCKLAVVDATGKVLDTAVIFPTPPQNRKEEAARTLVSLIRRHQVSCIAIGNGTASRESEQFVASVIEELGGELSYAVVNEAGASVYSASKLAAEEFPQYDVTLRSAVSIARRLQDPLAELVKIDPKAIGVGQYQHDMPALRLDEALGGVVEACVNAVGVDLNTASQPLLSQVAGVSARVARSIVSFREENGPFSSRAQLHLVPRLGPKTFEQCAGFLRVPQSPVVLDRTGIHPESYAAAGRALAALGYTLEDAAAGRVADLLARAQEYGLARLAQECGVGEPTLKDILSDLVKPGRDVRDALPPPLLRTGVRTLSDLNPGMELTGTVRNVVDFGAFVDIGVHEDGLLHISQFGNRAIRHPSQAVKVGDVVTVWVLSVDMAKQRISLTMRRPD